MDVARYSVRFPDGREFGPADMSMLEQWAREGRVPPDAMLIEAATGASRAVMTEASLASIIQSMGVQPMNPLAPPTFISPVAQKQGDESISVIIPYKNPHALTGYYISIGSLIPLVGPIAGPIAIVLGVIGIKKRSANPQLHGLAHAWIAIVLGAVGTLIGLGCGLSMIAAMIDQAGR